MSFASHLCLCFNLCPQPPASKSSSTTSSIHHLWRMLLRHPQLTIFISSETIHILVTLTNSEGEGEGWWHISMCDESSAGSWIKQVWTTGYGRNLNQCSWCWAAATLGCLTDKYQRCHLQHDCPDSPPTWVHMVPGGKRVNFRIQLEMKEIFCSL